MDQGESTRPAGLGPPDADAREASATDLAERLGLALSAARAGACDWHLDSGKVSWSREVFEIFGYEPSRGEPSYSEWLVRSVHPDDRSRVEEIYRLALTVGPDELHLRYRILHPDGGTRWVEGAGRVVRDGAGTPVRVVGLKMDVTARQRNEQELAHANALLDAIFEAAPIGLGLWDTELRFVRVNKRLAEMNGLPPDAHIGKRLDQILPNIEKLGPTLERWRQVVESGEPWLNVEITGETPAAPGVVRSWNENFFPVRLASKVIGLGAVVEETTERKASEEALRDSERRLGQAATAARLTYSVVDLAADRVTTGENFADVLGYPIPPGTRVGEAEAIFLAHVPPSDRERLRSLRPNVLADTPTEAKVEYRVIGEDRRERWIESVWEVDRGTSGRPRRVLSVHLDISERKRREDQVSLLMREVNHRSKNLLAVVQSLARQTARDPATRVFVDQLSERLQALAASQDLIVRGEWRAVALADLVQSQLSHLGALSARVAVSGEQVQLTPAAAQGIGMALHELATNAMKYGALSTPHGAVTITWCKIPSVKGPRLVVRWGEVGGPTVTTPAVLGFGHTVITRMAAHAVKGEVELEYHASGVSWRLDGPLSEIACSAHDEDA